jgi:hypothetical protein
MSATTEQLLERIRALKESISSATLVGADTSAMLTELQALSKQLVTASDALNESKNILKG